MCHNKAIEALHYLKTCNYASVLPTNRFFTPKTVSKPFVDLLHTSATRSRRSKKNRLKTRSRIAKNIIAIIYAKNRHKKMSAQQYRRTFIN